MIEFGLNNYSVCFLCWIPLWNIVGGFGVVLFYGLVLLAIVYHMCLKNEDSEDSVFDLVVTFITGWFMFLNFVVSLVWYVMGAYWVWSALNYYLHGHWFSDMVREELHLGKKPRQCPGSVLWFSMAPGMHNIALFCEASLWNTRKFKCRIKQWWVNIKRIWYIINCKRCS